MTLSVNRPYNGIWKPDDSNTLQVIAGGVAVLTLTSTGMTGVGVDAIDVNVLADAAAAAQVIADAAAAGALADATDASETAISAATDALPWKRPVRATTTANITLANSQTIAGISIVGGDRVLVRAQTDAKENGIYDAVTIGAWTRSTDCDAGAEFVDAVVVDLSTDRMWTCTNDSVTLGSTNIVFADLRSRVSAQTNATSITMAADGLDIATQANTQSVGTLTVNAPTGNPVDGQKILLRIKSTNVQTFAWNGAFRGSTDTPLPTATTGSTKTDYFGFAWNAADSKWDFLAQNLGY